MFVGLGLELQVEALVDPLGDMKIEELEDG